MREVKTDKSNFDLDLVLRRIREGVKLCRLSVFTFTN